MTHIWACAMMLSSAAALRLPTPSPSRLAVAQTSSAALALGVSAPAVADFFEEINKPPISLNPFVINPVGYTFFAGYAAYLGWQIFRPPSDAETAAAEKRSEAADATAAASIEFCNKAAESPGATVTASGLVFEEITAGEGEMPGLEQMVSVSMPVTPPCAQCPYQAYPPRGAGALHWHAGRRDGVR